MRIETLPYSKMKHGQVQTLIPQSRFTKCPHCLNGVAKQSVDAKDLVWDCVMCGWSKPAKEPEHKRYREVNVLYDSKRY